MLRRIDRGEADATNVVVQPVFERADAPFDIALRDARCDRRRGNMRGGAQQVVERDHAAAMQLKHARLQAFGAPVLEVRFDR